MSNLTYYNSCYVGWVFCTLQAYSYIKSSLQFHNMHFELFVIFNKYMDMNCLYAANNVKKGLLSVVGQECTIVMSLKQKKLW